MYWALSTPNSVRIYTDRRNLLYVFAPFALCSNAPRYGLAKVHLWTSHMSRFEFVIEHIEGVNDVFPDYLVSLFHGNREREATCGSIALLCQTNVPKSTNLAKVSCEEVRTHNMDKIHQKMLPEAQKDNGNREIGFGYQNGCMNRNGRSLQRHIREVVVIVEARPPRTL